MLTVWVILGVNMLLALFWVVGEYVINNFDYNLRVEINSGREWQDEQNREQNFDIETLKVRTRERHCKGLPLALVVNFISTGGSAA